MSLFRRLSAVHCFFCQSTVTPAPHDYTNFRCPACGCWNRYNKQGEIISDEPAMHEEHLNQLNFAKRASQSKDQLPNLHRSGPFCHNCQTNQMLVMNLLSNYLPSQESPDYEQRLKQLPVYKESLYSRYPPVCEECQPAVEEELHNKEQMARRRALNGWLKGGKERQRQVSATRAAVAVKDKIAVKSLHWRIRGVLWFVSAAVSISSLVLELLGHSISSQLHWSISTLLPVLVVASLLWTAWDPTYLVVHKAQLQRRDVRIQGKRWYIICQMTAWVFRLVFSISLLLHRKGSTLLPNSLHHPQSYLSLALCSELVALLAYPLFMRVQHPPPIRLIDTHSHLSATRSNTPATSSSSAPTPISTTRPKLPEHDLLASLSLSSKPIVAPTPPPAKPKPIFGMPSLGSLRATAPPSLEPRVKREEDEDAMDWSPTDEEPPRLRAHASEDSSNWLRPQRFFPPEKPTGLENIMARSLHLDDDMMNIDPQETSSLVQLLRNWRQWYLPVLFTICAMLAASCAFWLIRLRNPRPPIPSFEYGPQSYSTVPFYEEL